MESSVRIDAISVDARSDVSPFCCRAFIHVDAGATVSRNLISRIAGASVASYSKMTCNDRVCSLFPPYFRTIYVKATTVLTNIVASISALVDVLAMRAVGGKSVAAETLASVIA
jgi:hypothetical protein